MILKADELVNLNNAVIQPVQLPGAHFKNISVSVIRIDKIHAIISGNKWFKLKYNLENAFLQNKKHIITFGGAWSNHIVAVAYLCRQLGLECSGIIRGEQPEKFSETLKDAAAYEMELRFVSRDFYKNKKSLTESLQKDFPEAYIIPEGGQNDAGIQGAAEIVDLIPKNQFTHIACAVGTGTMIAGLTKASHDYQNIIGIPVLRVDPDKNDILDFVASVANGKSNFQFNYDYHFGGYAKYDNELIAFMNQLYLENGIPTDFVYTGKLFFAVNDLVAKNFFEEGSEILIIHSGGLQGNRSIKQLME